MNNLTSRPEKEPNTISLRDMAEQIMDLVMECGSLSSVMEDKLLANARPATQCAPLSGPHLESYLSAIRVEMLNLRDTLRTMNNAL